MEEYELQELCDTALRLDDIFKEKLQFEFSIEDDRIAIVKIEALKDRIVKEIEKEIILKEPKETRKTNVLFIINWA